MKGEWPPEKQAPRKPSLALDASDFFFSFWLDIPLCTSPKPHFRRHVPGPVLHPMNFQSSSLPAAEHARGEPAPGQPRGPMAERAVAWSMHPEPRSSAAHRGKNKGGHLKRKGHFYGKQKIRGLQQSGMMKGWGVLGTERADAFFKKNYYSLICKPGIPGPTAALNLFVATKQRSFLNKNITFSKGLHQRRFCLFFVF